MENEVISLSAPKACSGKCTSGACASSPKVWVLAVCGGMTSLFKKYSDGRLEITEHEGFENTLGFSLSSVDMFSYLASAAKCGKFNQLVLAGGAKDIAFAMSELPQSVAAYVIAEIQYPLPRHLFKHPDGLKQLTAELEYVFSF